MDSDQKIVYSIIEKRIKKNRKGEKPRPLLTIALGIGTREMISLVGAGGKTTLMFRLARELFLSGKNVVTTTTTKIMEPASDETNFLLVETNEEKIKNFVKCHLRQYRHITVAGERLGSGKLKGISSNLINQIWSFPEIDAILIEADGAAGRAVKAPRKEEPIIPSGTTLVVAMLGMDGIGMELNDQYVFQPERVSSLTGIPVGGRLTGEALALLMIHPEGLFKRVLPSSRRIAFLNKVDIMEGMAGVENIARKILEKSGTPVERVVLGQLKKKSPVVKVIFP